MRKRFCFALLFVLATLGWAVVSPVEGAAVAAAHPFTANDLVMLDRVSDLQLSPDGRWLACTVRSTDLEANRGRTDLWLVDPVDGSTQRLTTHPENDSSPRWAPDGRTVYFVSSRSGSRQVWRIPVSGGEAEQVTDLPLNVGELLVSPDGRRLFVTVEVFPDCPDLECTRRRLQEREQAQGSGRVFDRLFVRHWDTWKDGRRSHVFAYDLETGELRDLMPGLDADCPSKPFGGSEEIAVSPDGRWVVFTVRVAGREEAWSTNFDLFAVPADGSRPPRNLTADNLAWDTQPSFSPDGRQLAYLAMSRAGFEADRFRVMVRPWPEGTPREVAPSWDRSPSSLAWTPDGKSLLVTADHLGRHPLFRIAVSTGDVELLAGDGSVASPAPARERVFFLRDSLTSPADIWVIEGDRGEPRQITAFNRERLAQVRMGRPEQFTFAGWNGETVYAWIVEPVDRQEGVRYPVAFLIHGGPQGSFGDHFHYRWNPQVYAGAGYAAVMVDFHGSTGYGQAFTDSISGDWGGKPLEDLQKGLAAALERYPWMDGERVAALGASYGGYMINWIAGNWPDRFRCLVNHDGVFDERAMYFTTEELWFPEWEHGGPYWENPEGYEKHNPARFVDRWRTPMLVIHGALDFRVPLDQGIATFTALQRRGIPSRLLYFPDENHWVLKPQNSLQWHQVVLEWLHQWLRHSEPER
ncbi:MAG: S9 family peptidase [Acidobacteriota bacterium]